MAIDICIFCLKCSVSSVDEITYIRSVLSLLLCLSCHRSKTFAPFVILYTVHNLIVLSVSAFIWSARCWCVFASLSTSVAIFHSHYLNVHNAWWFLHILLSIVDVCCQQGHKQISPSFVRSRIRFLFLFFSEGLWIPQYHLGSRNKWYCIFENRLESPCVLAPLSSESCTQNAMILIMLT